MKTPDESSSPAPHRPQRRVRALIVVTAAILGLYVFAQLDRSVAEWLGVPGEVVHDLLSPNKPNQPPLSRAARQFKREIAALHATGDVWVQKPGFLGIFGREEIYNVAARSYTFGDAALAQIAERYGPQIMNLNLENTSVTNEGLRHLSRLTRIRHLDIRHYRTRARPGQAAPAALITDSGLIHLAPLPLWSLNLDGLPITDAGLSTITSQLPGLRSLYLSDTLVEGRSLAGALWLGSLSILYLDRCPVTAAAIGGLKGATSLQILSLKGAPLADEAIPALQAIPRLDRLEIADCGLTAAQIAPLIRARPGLKVDLH